GPALEKDESFLQHLRDLDRTSTWTVGVCNGVGLLAAAGVLRGKKATTNWLYQDRLRQLGVGVGGERYHREGKDGSGAGGSARLDTALCLAAAIAGDQVARTLQFGIE